MAGKIEYAQLLNDASEVQFKQLVQDSYPMLTPQTGKNTISLELPVRKPNVEVPVIELFLK